MCICIVEHSDKNVISPEKWYDGTLEDGWSNYDTIMTTTALSFTVTEIVGKKVKRWQVNLILYTVYELQNICYQSWKIGYGTFAKRWGSTVLQSAVIPLFRGRRGHDRIVVGFTIAYAISSYHHWNCEFESHSDQMYLIQH
jgi:hypothetical protein